jgi:hypothetical protein
MTQSRKLIAPNHHWTDSEIAMLRRDYHKTPTAKIAEAMGVKPYVVSGKAAKMGIRKSAEYLASPAACRMRVDTIGARTRFLPGQIPWNKGLRGTNYPGMVATQFKPGYRGGRAMERYKPIGTERVTIDGYLERKINDDMPLQKRWRAVHIVLWEEVNGPLPAGHALVFRDGNKRNICLENLELLTRAELMRRNSCHNHGPEIAKLVQLRGAINRMINNKEVSACPTT